MLKKLYLRIWLAVVLAVAVLTFLVGWAWRQAAEPPLRQLVLRNEAGQVIGIGHPHMTHGGVAGNGPEFVLQLNDGQTLTASLPRPLAPGRMRAPFGFFWTLTLVAIAVALATYPIIRKLTRRLEILQLGVAKWGEGDLSSRVPVSGQDEVAFLAQRFNQSAQRIELLIQSHEALLASQKSLLANASHELRSPLARIRMGLELLETSSAPAVREEIALNIAELDQLIEEILLASRLDAKEADLGILEPIDLIGLLAEECARTHAQLEIQGPPVQLGTDANLAGASGPRPLSLMVQGVAKLLRRAVRNLLENAQRHAAGGVDVRVVASTGQVQISVCDRGPGVPETYRDRIFEPFYRLPGAAESHGGVGLGLALVKAIALRHGGEVRCEGRMGGGACFLIILPLVSPICGMAQGAGNG